uniref:G protein nucleolar 3 like n=1 Tax=Myotis myotis TaxID=51298 RepID=A0A7J7YCX5_MYOMY|nr:G protein nucleolar 3 like [Myotis myotis]
MKHLRLRELKADHGPAAQSPKAEARLDQSQLCRTPNPWPYISPPSSVRHLPPPPHPFSQLCAWSLEDARHVWPHQCPASSPLLPRFMQEVHLDKFIRLLDAPGIVPGPNSEVGTILRNCIHVQKLADPVTPVETILQRCNLEEISNYYGVSGFQTTEHFLMAVAQRLGKKKKGGIYNQEEAAKAVLSDWVSGKISFYTLPPATHTLPTHLSAEIVKEMTEVFDIEDTEQANEDTMECLANGESDQLLGDIDSLQTEIKWLHSPMMKIVDALENKTTVYKNGEFTEYCMNSNGHQKEWAKRNADSYPRNICPVDRRPMVQKIMETDPLQQGQALACALKNKKKMQKRTDKLASKLSDSMMSALDLSGNTDDSAGD